MEEKRVITDNGMIKFFKSRTTRRFRKLLGISFPLLGKDRGNMIINKNSYSLLVRAFFKYCLAGELPADEKLDAKPLTTVQ